MNVQRRTAGQSLEETSLNLTRIYGSYLVDKESNRAVFIKDILKFLVTDFTEFSDTKYVIFSKITTLYLKKRIHHTNTIVCIVIFAALLLRLYGRGA